MVGRAGSRVENQDRDVYAHFNNDGEGNAVRDAWILRQPLGRAAGSHLWQTIL
jgi:hypothetical protein